MLIFFIARKKRREISRPCNHSACDNQENILLKKVKLCGVYLLESISEKLPQKLKSVEFLLKNSVFTVLHSPILLFSLFPVFPQKYIPPKQKSRKLPAFCSVFCYLLTFFFTEKLANADNRR